jgi:energy-coupling factor transport system permease protein
MRKRSRILYRPGDSPLHRAHPLTKLAWLVALSVMLFVLPREGSAARWLIVLAILTISLFLLRIAGLNPLRDLRAGRLLLSTALLLFFLQALFLRRGQPILYLSPRWPITALGVEMGLVVAGRFMAIIWLSLAFVATTDPNLLAHALMRAGLPYRYGFALITALRLAPLFEIEGSTVYEAQLARGARYDLRSPQRVLALLRQLLLPLLVSAMSKVDALAVSMEGRCFGRYPTRTYLREAAFTRSDAWAGALLLATIALWALWRWVG